MCASGAAQLTGIEQHWIVVCYIISYILPEQMIMMIKVKLVLHFHKQVLAIVDSDSTRYPLSVYSDLKTQNCHQHYFHYFSCLVFTSVLLQKKKKKSKKQKQTNKQKHSITEIWIVQSYQCH